MVKYEEDKCVSDKYEGEKYEGEKYNGWGCEFFLYCWVLIWRVVFMWFFVFDVVVISCWCCWDLCVDLVLAVGRLGLVICWIWCWFVVCGWFVWSWVFCVGWWSWYCWYWWWLLWCVCWLCVYVGLVFVLGLCLGFCYGVFCGCRLNVLLNGGNYWRDVSYWSLYSLVFCCFLLLLGLDSLVGDGLLVSFGGFGCLLVCCFRWLWYWLWCCWRLGWCWGCW